MRCIDCLRHPADVFLIHWVCYQEDVLFSIRHSIQEAAARELGPGDRQDNLGRYKGSGARALMKPRVRRSSASQPGTSRCPERSLATGRRCAGAFCRSSRSRGPFRTSRRRISAEASRSTPWPPSAAELFQQTYGVPPHLYLIVARIEAVKMLLRSGRTPAHAASACGFADQSHMSRHFLSIVGTTPARYAEAMRD